MEFFPPAEISSAVFPFVSSRWSVRRQEVWSVARRGSASQIMNGEKLLGEKFLDQMNFPEYRALMKLGAKYASCIPKFPN